MIWLFTFNYKISSKINNCVLHFIQNRKRTASKCWTVILILGCKLENRYGWSLKKIRNDTQYLQNMYLTCVPAGPPRELLGPRSPPRLSPSSQWAWLPVQYKIRYLTKCVRLVSEMTFIGYSHSQKRWKSNNLAVSWSKRPTCIFYHSRDYAIEIDCT